MPKQFVVVLLVLWLACKCHDLMPVGVEDVLLATSKVCMYLTGKQRILRYVGISGVFVHRQHKQPDDADEYT